MGAYAYIIVGSLVFLVLAIYGIRNLWKYCKERNFESFQDFFKNATSLFYTSILFILSVYLLIGLAQLIIEFSFLEILNQVFNFFGKVSDVLFVKEGIKDESLGYASISNQLTVLSIIIGLIGIVVAILSFWGYSTLEKNLEAKVIGQSNKDFAQLSDQIEKLTVRIMDLEMENKKTTGQIINTPAPSETGDYVSPDEDQ